MAQIEMLTLANHAEAVNNLLYLHGAGWDAVLRAPEQEAVPHPFGIGISVLVPWTEANRPHGLVVWIESEDGGDPLLRFDGQIEVARPVGTPEGIDLRSVLAVNAALPFVAGGYRLVAELDETERRTYSFRVVPRPPGA